MIALSIRETFIVVGVHFIRGPSCSPHLSYHWSCCSFYPRKFVIATLLWVTFQTASAFAFQSATHEIISFIILANMSISHNNKSLDNCVAMKHNNSKTWLLYRHMTTQYMLSGHMSAQYVLCGQFCWFSSFSWS